MPLHRSQYRGQCQCPYKMLSPSSVREHRNNSRRSDAMFPMLMMIMMMTSGHAYVPPSCSSFSHHQHRRASSLRRVQSFGVKNSVTRQRKKRFQYWSVTNNNDEIQDEQQSYNVVKTMSPDTSNESKLDNLIPSTMISSSKRRTNSFVAANTGVGRMDTNRRHTGLSSSVLLPSSLSSASDDRDTTLPPLFFQSTIPSPTDSLDVSTISKNSDNNNNNGSWKERLLDVSNFASLLCVLDCTLLPLVSIAIPAISWGLGFILGSGGAVSTTIPPALSAFLAYLPALSHGIALYFVIPVGLLTTIINYFFGHREIKFSMAALFGVTLIYVANSSAGVGIPSIDAMLHSAGIVAGGVHDHAGHVHNACGAMVGAATNMMAHTCPEGWAHRMTNTLGCAFLMFSNYASRKYMEEKNSGCAASALAEAWGGDSGRQVVCPPGCGCEKPSFGTKGSSSRTGGEMFFQWERKSPVSERSSRFRR